MGGEHEADTTRGGVKPIGPDLSGSSFVFDKLQLIAPGRPGLRAWLGASRGAHATQERSFAEGRAYAALPVSADYSAPYGLSCEPPTQACLSLRSETERMHRYASFFSSCPSFPSCASSVSSGFLSPYRRRKRSTRPAASTIRCLPV